MLEPSDTDECARYLKVVADPDRLLIIQRLQVGPRNVSTLAEELGKVIANVSHHLKILRQAGLVTTKRDGKFVSYALDERFFPNLPDGATGCCLDLGCCQLELPERRTRLG